MRITEKETYLYMRTQWFYICLSIAHLNLLSAHMRAHARMRAHLKTSKKHLRMRIQNRKKKLFYWSVITWKYLCFNDITWWINFCTSGGPLQLGVVLVFISFYHEFKSDNGCIKKGHYFIIYFSYFRYNFDGQNASSSGEWKKQGTWHA